MQNIVLVERERRDLLAAKLVVFERSEAAVCLAFGNIDFNALHE